MRLDYYGLFLITHNGLAHVLNRQHYQLLVWDPVNSCWTDNEFIAPWVQSTIGFFLPPLHFTTVLVGTLHLTNVP